MCYNKRLPVKGMGGLGLRMQTGANADPGQARSPKGEVSRMIETLRYGMKYKIFRGFTPKER